MKDGTERKLRATRVGRLILVNERDLLAFLNLGGVCNVTWIDPRPGAFPDNNLNPTSST